MYHLDSISCDRYVVSDLDLVKIVRGGSLAARKLSVHIPPVVRFRAQLVNI